MTTELSVEAVACEATPAPQAPGSSRIGLIVPSSNTTMETEVPEILRIHEALTGDSFSVHSGRKRMTAPSTAGRLRCSRAPAPWWKA